MKAVLTLILVVTFGAFALANTNTDAKVDIIEMGIVLDSGADLIGDSKEVKTFTETSVARLYRYKNSRIKKALAFSTKRNKAKMA